MIHRAKGVPLLLQAASVLGLAPETGHDAVQLMDRASAAGLDDLLGSSMLMAACLTLAGAAAVSMPLVATLFELQQVQLTQAVDSVRAALGGNVVVVSAARVLGLLLQRLGLEGGMGRGAATGETAAIAGNAPDLMDRTAASPAFIGAPPLSVAICVLYVARLAAGMAPVWPAALATLTGVGKPQEILPAYVQAAMRLLLPDK